MAPLKRDPFPQGTLNLRTYQLVKKHQAEGTSLPMIAEQCGVPYLWLRQYAGGTFTNPGVDRVQALYEGLTGRKLISD